MMRKLFFPFVVMSLLLAAAFGLIQVASGQGPDGTDKPQVLNQEVQGANVREISAPAQSNVPQQPSISFIDSPTIGCHMPDPAQDACYINWYYMSVSANPNYMVAMTVTVNTVGIVAKLGGFFQTSMYVPHDMFGQGFKVACGAPGAGGDPNLGNAYSWTIQARDSSNLSSANYGTAYCPFYRP
jgi:hypothetical protein